MEDQEKVEKITTLKGLAKHLKQRFEPNSYCDICIQRNILFDEMYDIGFLFCCKIITGDNCMAGNKFKAKPKKDWYKFEVWNLKKGIKITIKTAEYKKGEWIDLKKPLKLSDSKKWEVIKEDKEKGEE